MKRFFIYGHIIVSTLMIAVGLTACQQAATTQQQDKDEEHGSVIAHELSNSRVQCIAEDATGQLWIGTFRGLNRYDGHEYHQYFCTPTIRSRTYSATVGDGFG